MKTWRDNAIAVIAEVGTASGISPEEMLGDHRQPHIVRARHEAMLAVRERLELSYPAIGEVFVRDHTTVMHGCQAARKRRDA